MVFSTLSARRAAWQAFARESGGSYGGGSLLRNIIEHVEVPKGNWVFLLDVNARKRPHKVRMRVAFKLMDPALTPEFSLDEGSHFQKLIGRLGLDVGHSIFDRRFHLSAQSPEFALNLFKAPEIRDICLKQPQLSLKLRNRYSLIKTRFPKGVFELCFEEKGREIHDAGRLAQTMNLLLTMLNHLKEKGIVADEHPGIRLKPGPDGRNGRLAWERLSTQQGFQKKDDIRRGALPGERLPPSPLAG